MMTIVGAFVSAAMAAGCVFVGIRLRLKRRILLVLAGLYCVDLAISVWAWLAPPSAPAFIAPSVGWAAALGTLIIHAAKSPRGSVH